MSGSLSGPNYALANQPAVKPQTPFDTYQQALGIAQGMNQNKLFQGQVAAGQAYQQATDPQGRVDLPTLNRLLAQNPATAPYMPTAAQQSQGLATSQQQNALQRFTWMGGALGSLISDNSGQGPDFARVQEVLAAGMKGGYLSQTDAAAALTGMPPGDDPQSRATRLHMLQTVNEQLQSAQQRLTNATGTPGIMGNGQVNQPGTFAGPLSGRPQGAFSAAGPGVQQQTAPGENASLVPVTKEDPAHPGQYIQVLVPRSSLPGASGSAGPQQGSGSGAAPAAPGGGAAVLAAPPPAAAANNAADVTQYRNALGDVPNAEQRIRTLQEARAALSEAKTGKGSSSLQSVLSVINTFNPDLAKSLGSETGTDAEKYDLARKYLTDYMRSSGAASQSDAQLAAAAGSNASVDITNEAARHVVSLQIGRERQRIAAVQQAPDQQGIGFGQHASKFASSTDPRGFAWDTYTPEQQQAMLKSLANDKSGLERLYRSIGKASRLKLSQ